MINLEAEGYLQEKVLEYLNQNASEVLTEKINNGKKTLKGCAHYITGEARKQAKNGSACIEDSVVFGWAVHYFEEDAIPELGNYASFAKPQAQGVAPKVEKPVKVQETKKPEPKKAPVEEQLPGQMSLFDFA